MTEQQTPTTQTPDKPAPKRKRWKKWIIGFGVVIVLLVLLVALLPTIIGLSPVRSFVASQASGYLDGRVEIGELSVGWFSPVRVGGVRIYDNQNRLVLDISKVETEATLSSLAGGSLDLGKTVIIADVTQVIVRPDGQTNLHDVFNISATPATKTEPKPDAGAALEVPQVVVDLSLDLRGGVQVVDERGQQVAKIDIRPGTGGTVKIDDINKGVAPDLKLVYDIGTGQSSTISINGSVDAVQNNQLDLKSLAAQIKLALKDVDLAVARPALAIAGVNGVDLAGVANGQIDADLKDGQSGSIKGTPTITGLAFAHPALADKYSAREVSLPIDIARTVAADASKIDIDIKAIAPELTASISGMIPESAIENLVAKKMPGADGHLAITLDAKPDVIAASFPKTLNLREDVKVESGRVYSKVDVWPKPDSVVYSLDTTAQARGQQAGKPIAIEPVQIVAAGTLKDLGDPMKGLRDLSVSLASSFATFKASGESVARVSGGGEADLDLLRQQVSQFVDLQGTQLAGKAVFGLKNEQQAEGAYKVDLGTTLTGINASVPNQPAIKIGYAKIGLSGAYTVGADTTVKSIDTATISALVGDDEKSALLDLLIGVTGLDPVAQTVQQFDAQRITVTSLPRLQQMLEPFVPQLKEQKIDLQSGAVYLVSKGSADLKQMRFTLENVELSAPTVRVAIDGKPVLDEKRIYVSTAGRVSAGKRITLDLSRLTFESAIASLNSNDQPVNLTLGDGLPTGQAKFGATLNFVPLNRIAQAFSSEPVPTITNGQLTGDLTFTNEGNKPTVAFAGKVDALSIDQTPITNETIAIALNAVTTGDLNRASASANVKGSFVSLVLKDTTVNLADGTPMMKMVETASLVLGIPDAQKAAAVATALVPGLSLPYNPAGGVALSADVKGTTATIDLKASQLALTHPATNKTYRFDRKKPVSLVAGVDIAGLDTIQKLTLTKLEGDLDVAQIAMIEPIVVDDPMGTPAPRGKVRVSGAIERVTPLVQFLQQADKPLPYRGMFELTPAFSSSGSTVAFTPNGSISDFAIVDDTGKPTFTEKQVTLAGDISADTEKKSATIKSLNIDMASSKAANVSVTGGVRDYDKDLMQLDNIVAKVNAVGEKAWPIIFPLLPPEQQANLSTAQLAGPITFDMTANGAYGIGAESFDQAIKPLKVQGKVTLSRANLDDAYGLSITNLTQLFSIDDGGRLVTGVRGADGKWQFAPPFDVNGGKGDLGSVVVVLGDPNMPVSIGKKQKLLAGVQLNPVMAAQLGSLASVMFKDSKTASGLVDVIVMDCRNVPLADLLAGSKKAKAEIIYNIKDLRLDGPVPSTLASVLGWGDKGIVGKIENGSLVLSDGIAHQNMTIDLLKVVNVRDEKTGERKAVDQWQQLMFKGGINIEKQRFQDYSLWMSQGLLLQDWRKSFPNGATVQLKGDVADIGSIMTQTIGSLAIQGYGGSLIDDLLNKKKK